MQAGPDVVPGVRGLCRRSIVPVAVTAGLPGSVGGSNIEEIMQVPSPVRLACPIYW